MDEVIWLSDIMDNPGLYKEPEPIIPLLAWENRLTMLAGREKGGKSTLVSAAAAAISKGEPFLEAEMKEGKILWVSWEETKEDIGRRFLQFGGDESKLALLLHPENPYESVKTLCIEHDFSLIIWDSLSRVADTVSKKVPDPGNAPMWTRIIAPILDIAHEYATSILLHHAKKDGRGYRDSTGIGAAPDVIIEMSKAKQHKTHRFLDRKGRFGFSEDTISLEGEKYVIIEKEDLDKRILAFVKKNAGCSSGALKVGLGGNAQDIVNETAKLLKNGSLTDEGTDSKHEYHVFALKR